MKTLNWTGFMGAPRREPHTPGLLARLVRSLFRGAVPIDGHEIPKAKPVRAPRPEPVRWGNFR